MLVGFVGNMGWPEELHAECPHCLSVLERLWACVLGLWAGGGVQGSYLGSAHTAFLSLRALEHVCWVWGQKRVSKGAVWRVPTLPF